MAQLLLCMAWPSLAYLGWASGRFVPQVVRAIAERCADKAFAFEAIFQVRAWLEVSERIAVVEFGPDFFVQDHWDGAGALDCVFVYVLFSSLLYFNFFSSMYRRKIRSSMFSASVCIYFYIPSLFQFIDLPCCCFKKMYLIMFAPTLFVVVLSFFMFLYSFVSILYVISFSFSMYLSSFVSIFSVLLIFVYLIPSLFSAFLSM